MAELTAQTCFAAVAQHQKDLPPGAKQRWAFLVTMEELHALMDEFDAQPRFGMVFEPAHAQHIREGRAMLFINGTPVLPELIPAPESGQTDG